MSRWAAQVCLKRTGLSDVQYYLHANRMIDGFGILSFPLHGQGAGLRRGDRLEPRCRDPELRDYGSSTARLFNGDVPDIGRVVACKKSVY